MREECMPLQAAMHALQSQLKQDNGQCVKMSNAHANAAATPAANKAKIRSNPQQGHDQFKLMSRARHSKTKSLAHT